MKHVTRALGFMFGVSLAMVPFMPKVETTPEHFANSIILEIGLFIVGLVIFYKKGEQ